MMDITNPTWIKAKGILFLLVGLLAATLLALEHPTQKITLLLALAIWCSCRLFTQHSSGIQLASAMTRSRPLPRVQPK